LPDIKINRDFIKCLQTHPSFIPLTLCGEKRVRGNAVRLTDLKKCPHLNPLPQGEEIGIQTPSPDVYPDSIGRRGLG
jgi:hypothetical protein